MSPVQTVETLDAEDAAYQQGLRDGVARDRASLAEQVRGPLLLAPLEYSTAMAHGWALARNAFLALLEAPHV